MKRFKHGFLLGKFMPVHKGHMHMIETAIKNCENVTVLVCSIPTEPIPGHLRYVWVADIFPNVNVIHVTDDVPHYPHENSNFWNIWTALLKKYIHPETDVFYSSEEYGYEVAARLNIRHEIVDLERECVPISATAIRTDPVSNWNYIPDIVKPYMVTRVVMTGPESTGKSTMAETLATHYNTTFATEYARGYCDPLLEGYRLTPEDFNCIARGQFLEEGYAAVRANKYLFCDTDLIVTKVYSEMYNGSCPKFITNMIKGRKYALHLLMDIDVPWEDDKTRVFLDPKKRKEHFDRIRTALDAYGYKYVIISGIGEERLKNAIRAIENLRK